MISEKNSFIVKSQKQLLRLTQNTTNHPFIDQSHLSSLYNLLKNIQINAAFFKYYQIYEIATFLLQRLQLNRQKITLKNNEDNLFPEGLRLLHEAFEAVQYHKQHKEYIDGSIINNDPEYNSDITDFRFQSSTIENEKKKILTLIEKEWVRYQRFQSTFSLILIKIMNYNVCLHQFQGQYYEYFSQINSIIGSSIRPYDELGLWSKDVLLLLLPATSLDGAHMAIQRIMQQIDGSSNHLSNYVVAWIMQSEQIYSTSRQFILQLENEVLKNPQPLERITLITSTNHVGKLAISERNEKKILIIDDDLISSTVLFTNLKEENWDVEVCHDGSKALEIALRYQPDLILCETKINDLDGFSLCMQVKQIPQCRDTIFCFLSKQYLKQFIIRAYQVGADDYFTKPFTIQEIEMRMNYHLKRKSM